MGVGVSRIEQEFILTTVTDKHIPLTLHGARQEARGTIISFTDSDIEVELDGSFNAAVEDRVRVFFSYFGHVMTFATHVKRGSSTKVVFSYPKGIYKHLQRKYERIAAPADAEVSFQLDNMKVELEFPKSQEFNPADKPVLSERFKSDSIAGLMKTFRQTVSARCDEETVTMFRGRQPESFEERIISRTGKILYIPDTREPLPDEDDSLGDRVITTATLQDPAFAELAQKDIGELLRSKHANGIFAEIYCPILYQEYAVGFVYLASHVEDAIFDEDLVRLVREFTQVLAYSLNVNNYFAGSQSGLAGFEAKIVDFSASGLLFSHNSDALKENLMIYSDLVVAMKLGPRRLRIASRVMRKYEDRQTTYYAVQFLDMDPEDFRFLFDFAYGRTFTKEDNELWEGGSPPPPLEL